MRLHADRYADLTGVIGYDRLIAPAFRVGAAFGYIDGRVNNNVKQTGRTRTSLLRARLLF